MTAPLITAAKRAERQQIFDEALVACGFRPSKAGGPSRWADKRRRDTCIRVCEVLRSRPDAQTNPLVEDICRLLGG